MSGFIYHRHGNPCPICGGTKTQCRTTTIDDGRRKTHCRGKVEAPAGWGYVGDDRNGFAQFIEGWNDRSDRDWDEISRRRAEREAQQSRHLAKAALTEKRDRVYRTWQPSQRLSMAHRGELARRGLTEDQIARTEALGWVRTWVNGLRFVPQGVPGQTWDGRLKSAMGADGLAIAAPNWKGQIAGFQVRPDDQTLGKYLSLPGQHLKNGEQPMPVFANPDGHTGPVTIAITEAYLKPLVTGFRHWGDRPDLVMVGSNGSNWAGHRAQWKRLIEHFTPQGIAAIELWPDAGARGNDAIVRQATDLADLLQSLGHRLEVRWWGQWDKEGKGTMDPDEAAPEMIWAGDLLTVEQFAVNGAIVLWSQGPQQMAVPRPGTIYPIRYRAGDRLKVWAWTEQHGLTVLDTSATGTGKSHDAGNFLWRTPEGRQRVFGAVNHRNPETSTLKQFQDMPAKHNGLILDPISRRWRHPRKGEVAKIAPNCARAHDFKTAYAVGLELAAGKDCAICQGCPWAEIERDGDDLLSLTCPYLDSVREAKKAAAYRAHPLSIKVPAPEIAQTVLVDEVATAIAVAKTLALTVDALTAQRRNAQNFTPKALFEAVVEPVIMAAIAIAMIGKGQPFGLSPAAAVAHLPSAQDLVDRAVAAGYTCLVPLSGEIAAIAAIKEMAQWFRGLRFGLKNALNGAKNDHERAEAIEDAGRSQAIALLLEVIAGDRQLTAAGGDLMIHTRNRPYRKGDAMILLDATAHPRDAEKQLGLPPHSLLWIEQQPPQHKSLTIKVITGIESPGMQRRESTMGISKTGRKAITFCDRLAALIHAICDRHNEKDQGGDNSHKGKVGVIDNQRFLGDIPELENLVIGQRYVESRGSNRFMDCKALVPIGTPAENLTAAAVEWGLARGRAVDPDNAPPAFWAWVDRRRAALAIQEGSRLRSHRRPDEPLTLYLTNPPKPILRAVEAAFPGAKVEYVDVMDIAPEAARKGRQTASALVAATIDGIRSVQAGITQALPTARAIAAEAGVAVGTLYDSLKRYLGMGFKELLERSVLLLGGLNNKTEHGNRLWAAGDRVWRWIDGEWQPYRLIEQPLGHTGWRCHHIDRPDGRVYVPLHQLAPMDTPTAPDPELVEKLETLGIRVMEGCEPAQALEIAGDLLHGYGEAAYLEALGSVSPEAAAALHGAFAMALETLLEFDPSPPPPRPVAIA